jgi:hypothetical protein
VEISLKLSHLIPKLTEHLFRSKLTTAGRPRFNPLSIAAANRQSVSCNLMSMTGGHRGAVKMLRNPLVNTSEISNQVILSMDYKVTYYFLPESGT